MVSDMACCLPLFRSRAQIGRRRRCRRPRDKGWQRGFGGGGSGGVVLLRRLPCIVFIIANASVFFARGGSVNKVAARGGGEGGEQSYGKRKAKAPTTIAFDLIDI